MTWAALGAVLLAGGMLMPSAQAQSADALLDKLVEKGILTVKEANELREQADDGFTKAYQTKSGMPDWVQQLRLYGDFRGRYENFQFDNGDGTSNKDRNRFRYRLRAGLTALLASNFEAGFRLTSSEPTGSFGGDPISGNTTFQDNGSKKFVYIDLAYGKWTPINAHGWTVSGIIGKIENPFTVSDMVFDGDYTPEGGALTVAYNINEKHSLKLVGGGFILDEIAQGSSAGQDALWLGWQGRWDAKWTPHLASTLGLGWFAVSDRSTLTNGAVPNINVGNTREPGTGVLAYQYNPIVADAAITYTLDKGPFYAGPFPVRVAGEYMYNPGAPGMNCGWWAGAFFGKSGKKRTWEASYRYKRLEADAWYEEFVDSDFGAFYPTGLGNSGQGSGYRAGTGLEGHIIKVVYSLSDAFSIGGTYFLVDQIDSPSGVADDDTTAHRLQIDAVWKF